MFDKVFRVQGVYRKFMRELVTLVLVTGLGGSVILFALAGLAHLIEG